MSWPVACLGEVVDILDSQRKPVTKADRRSGPYPYYGATGVLDWVEGYLFDEPLVLIGEDGAKWGAGDVSAFRIDGKTWVNNHAHVLRPHRNVLDDDWLTYYLNGADLSEYISGMTVPKLNQGNLRQIEVPLPPLDEQKRIVAVLDQAFAALDRARANAEANLADCDNMLAEELSKVFDEQDSAAVELQTLFDIGSSKRVLKSQWKTHGVPFYRGREITKLSIHGHVNNELFIAEEHFNELKRQHGAPAAGDIVITAIGTIGNAHVVRESDRFYFKDASVLWMKKTSNVSSDYVRAWLKSPRFFEQLDTGNGATVDTLTIRKLQHMKMSVPATEQQHRIVNRLDNLREQVSLLRKNCTAKLTDIAALRQSLLQAAFSGELT
ncbi:MAG: hypothetical protein DI635_08940 [Pseudoxanthomonas suwonensis]|nr:MAG: hypothetical protein DI635_08940 [Pseudoxanthomonas suwonensis]